MSDFNGTSHAYDVQATFKKFGLDATPEEISSFSGVDLGNFDQFVSDYVMTKKNLAEQKANDPLQKVLDAQKTFASAQQAAAAGYGKEANDLFSQLRDLMGGAPKLFGNLTPEQVDQYLAPLKQTFNEADATAQTGNAARGLAGSSIEANARAGEATKFKGQVLSKGLDVGMTQQQLQGNVLQNEINRKNGLLLGANNNVVSALGLQNQSAGQLSNISQQDANLLSSLPNYLRAQSLQELMARKAMNPDTPLGGVIGSSIGSLLLPGIGGDIGGAIGSGVTGDNAGTYKYLDRFSQDYRPEKVKGLLNFSGSGGGGSSGAASADAMGMPLV